MRVYNLTNARGNKVANQFVIEQDNGDIDFQSYDSLVCSVRGKSMGYDRVVVFGKDWDYSVTTMKHLNTFLRDNRLGLLASAKNIREALERGHARMDESIAVWFDPTL